jgi:hypothetical protein
VAGAHPAPVLPEFPEAAAVVSAYVAEKEAAASVVFNFAEQKLGCELKAAQTIALIASADLPPKLDSEVVAPLRTIVGDPETLYLVSKAKSF